MEQMNAKLVQDLSDILQNVELPDGGGQEDANLHTGLFRSGATVIVEEMPEIMERVPLCIAQIRDRQGNLEHRRVAAWNQTAENLGQFFERHFPNTAPTMTVDLPGGGALSFSPVSFDASDPEHRYMAVAGALLRLARNAEESIKQIKAFPPEVVGTGMHLLLGIPAKEHLWVTMMFYALACICHPHLEDQFDSEEDRAASAKILLESINGAPITHKDAAYMIDRFASMIPGEYTAPLRQYGFPMGGADA